jgi:hypothetical protein
MKKVLIASALTLNLMASGAFADENHSGGEVGSPMIQARFRALLK